MVRVSIPGTRRAFAPRLRVPFVSASFQLRFVSLISHDLAVPFQPLSFFNITASYSTPLSPFPVAFAPYPGRVSYKAIMLKIPRGVRAPLRGLGRASVRLIVAATFIQSDVVAYAPRLVQLLKVRACVLTVPLSLLVSASPDFALKLTKKPTALLWLMSLTRTCRAHPPP